MTPETAQWVRYAEEDLQGARDMALKTPPLRNLACFHCQQSAEKYLKASLLAQGITPPRIHDLEDLLNLCALHDAALATHLPLAQALNPFGVQIRYPGMSVTVAEANDALKTVRRLRTAMRRALGL